MFNKLKHERPFTNIYIQNKLKRLRKTALAFIMVVAMLIGLIPNITLKIEGLPSDYWTDSNNNPSTTWYTGHSSPYTISTAEQLAGLAKLVNARTDSFSGKTINLSAGIDLSAHLWTPIGTDPLRIFLGTFNGQNHIINGLTINKTSADYQGLFGYSHGCTMQNIGLTNTRISAQSYVGGIAGCLYNSTISNCYNTADISSSASYIGGIVGNNNNNVISTCYNAGTITFTANNPTHSDNGAGGICGRIGNSSTISNSYNKGNVQLTKSTNGCGNLGGIVGRQSNIDGNSFVEYCYNLGEIKVQSGCSADCASGISGLEDPYCNIQYCYNIGNVSGANHNGEIRVPMSTEGLSKIENCYCLDKGSGNANTSWVTKLSTTQLQNDPYTDLSTPNFKKSPFYGTNNFNQKYLVLDLFHYGDTVQAAFTGNSFVYDSKPKKPTFTFPSTSTIGNTIMPIDPSMYTVTYEGIEGTSYDSSPLPPSAAGSYTMTVKLDPSISGYQGEKSTTFIITNPIISPNKSSTTPTYSQNERKLSKLDSGTTSPINVAADASYTMQFSTNTYSASQAINHQLNFDKALPVGTSLTFVDHSSEKPNYYYYNVEKEVGANTPLFLNLFATMDPTNTLYTDPGSLSPPETITETLLFVVDFSQVASESRLSGDLLSTLNIDGIDIDHVTATITAASSSSGSIANTPETTDVSVDASSSNPGDEVLLVATLTKSINDVEKQISWSDTIKINGTYNQKIFENIKGGLAVLDLGKAQSTTTNYSLSGLTISGLPSGTYNLKLSVCVTSSSNASYPMQDIKASLATPITIQV